MDERHVHSVTNADVEQLLYDDAALLDDWKLEEWLQLLTDDAVYEVPGPDRAEGGAPLVHDDMSRLRSRVKALVTGDVVSEIPFSRTRRLITNVRIVRSSADAIDAVANFAIYRFSRDSMDLFVGRYTHTLVVRAGGLKFSRRRSILDNESLRPHGKLTIIL